MAQVAQDSQLQAKIERLLEYSLREWGAVPDYVAEFDTWDWSQQVAFVHEWSIREDALSYLTSCAEQGLMTGSQRNRYKRLLSLVAQHRPRIEKLRSE